MSTRAHVPNFIIVGAAKAGTTAIYHYLNQHPQVYLTPLKETNYFALRGQRLEFRGPGDDLYVNRLSITDPNVYRAQFDGVRDEVAIGEASPLYLYHPLVAGRINEEFPDAKIIAILRNPIDRAYSAFLHLVRDHREEHRDFERALSHEQERIADNWEHIWHYISMGRYYEQMKRYFDLFPREQVRVYLYKDLRADPCGLLRDTLRFIGVDENFGFDTSTRYNEASLPLEQRPPLLSQVRARLQRELRDDILKLQDLIERDVSHWLTPDLAEQEARF
ncbi:hypothetical protein IAD21_03004 [Abditibacteriota bacterium]|nr:hypothetical protein IAD21_03004 [Abditibacteriota bacterium]